MLRNVVQQGPVTLLVSLPRDWVISNKILKGDKLNVIDLNNKLLIEKHNTESRQVITLMKKGEFYTKRLILNSYLSGANEIKIKFPEIGSLIHIEKVLSDNLLGFELVEQTTTDCTLKNVMQDSENSFDTILRKTFLNLIQISEIFKKHINTQKEDTNIFVTLNKINSRQTHFLKRLINKGMFENSKNTSYYNLISILEKTSSQFEYFEYKNQQNTNFKINKKIINYYDRIHNLLLDIYKLFYNFSDNLFRKAMYENVMTSSRTNETIELLDLDPYLGYMFSTITSNLRDCGFEILSIKQ